MLKRWLILVLLVLVIAGQKLFAQKNLVISGGHTVSSYVCNNNQAFVWGSNTTGTPVVTGSLGVGSTNTTENAPKLVQYFVTNGITIKQINSGSGATFIALDCNLNVWSWGDNTAGEVGNGTTGNVVITPSQVLAGSVVGAHFKSAGGFLTNAKVVYCGSSNSFAILDDGTLAAWGSNSGTGQTGNA